MPICTWAERHLKYTLWFDLISYVISIGNLGLHIHIVIIKKFDNSENCHIHILYHRVCIQYCLLVGILSAHFRRLYRRIRANRGPRCKLSSFTLPAIHWHISVVGILYPWPSTACPRAWSWSHCRPGKCFGSQSGTCSRRGLSISRPKMGRWHIVR